MKSDAKIKIQEQKKSKKSRFLWYSLLIFCFLLFAFSPFLLFQDVPLRISKETTYLTEPLTADGTQVDYLRAIEERMYPPQMQSDDNGFRILIRAIGPPKEIIERNLKDQYYEKLGLPSTHTPTLKYVDEYEFVRNYLATNPDALEMWKEKYLEHRRAVDPTYDEDLSSESGTGLRYFIVDEIKGRGFAPWKEWITQIDPILDILAEAVSKPVFVAPYIPGDQGILEHLFSVPEIYLYRDLVRSLTQRTIYRVDNGDIDGAIDDIITCHRLAQHVKNQGFETHYDLGLVFEGRAFHQGPNANPEAPMNVEQIRRLFREIDNLPALQPFEERWNMERLMRLSILQKMIHLPKNQRREFFAPFFPTASFHVGTTSTTWWKELMESRNHLHLLGYNWNTVMKRFNEASEEILQGTWTEPTLSESHTIWWTQKGRSEELAKQITLFAPSGSGFMDQELKSQCRNKVQKLVLTMLLYEKEHGTLPPTFSVDANGTPLHSWRVLLLPYFGEKEKKLYENIRLNEPWNSDWNKQFHETDIAVYTCLSEASQRIAEGTELKGLCDYTVLVGNETPFAEKPTFDANEKRTLGRALKDFGPNTILLAERKEPIHWLDPTRKMPICWMDPTQEITQSDAEKFVGATISDFGSFGFKSGAVIHSSSITNDLEHFRKLVRGTAESMR